MAKQIRLSKLLSCLLALSLVFSLAVPAFAADPAAPSAAPSRQILIVDGKEVDAEAYAIGGYNYFKLRDIAMLLSGTEVQFDVAADDDSHTILAETGKTYTPVGGELAEGADNSATCAVSDWKLSVDGTTVEASVYALGGNNYFKLRDLGTALGFGVDYDAEKDAAVITSTPVDPLALAVTPTSESFTLDGKTVKYDAYTNVLYVSKPYDVKLQSMNIFVPEGADEDTPIILKSGSGAYMAAEAKTPTGEADDIISQALAEGYVVISPAARGRNVTYKDAEGNDVFYGTGPANAVDLKAAIRYLRYNDAAIPGDCDKIIVDGTSASGAMGAILGTSGDSAAYEPYLEEIGAADTSDAVFAVMNFCPIVDLDNVEIAYEWMFGPYYDLEFYQDPACEADIVLSDIMAGYYPAYLNSLGLKDPETGKALTLDEKDIYSGSYMDYLLGYINDAATEYLSDMTADEIAAYLDSEDAQGRKMSKSLGNGIDPLEVIDKYGADALRLTLITGNAPGNDMRFYWERVEASRNFANKVWNASRFIMMNLEGVELREPKLDELHAADKWILSRVNTLAKDATENMDKFELGIAVQKVYDFIWDEFCDWYIEIAKVRTYKKDENPESANAALWTLKTVLVNALKLLHPYMPFITEEIFCTLQSDEETIMLSKWPEYKEEWNFPAEEAAIEHCKDLVKGIRNVRTQMDVPPSRKAKLFITSDDEAVRKVFEDNKEVYVNLAFTSEIAVQQGKAGIGDDAVSVVIPDAVAYLPLEDLVDFEKEKERLNKEKDKLTKELARSRGMLSNEKFLNNAKPEKVQEEKDKLAKYEQMMAQVEERLAQFK